MKAVKAVGGTLIMVTVGLLGAYLWMVASWVKRYDPGYAHE